MRQTLIDLIKRTIIYEYELPNASNGIFRAICSTENDHCYRAEDMAQVADVIYNSIVEYAYNEFDLTDRDFDALHSAALRTKLRYDHEATDEAKLKYGFFGEVLLYAILLTNYHARPLIARGYFYNPLENSETKGYDAYQLVDTSNGIELWFGEVKFHAKFSSGIDSVMGNLSKALSDKYLETNILALSNHKHNLNVQGSAIEAIITKWEADPSIKIINELREYNMTLVYPVLILYEGGDGGYDDSIRAVPEYIAAKYAKTDFEITVPFKVFFILMPLSQVKKIKQSVIEWIELKRPLTL